MKQSGFTRELRRGTAVTAGEVYVDPSALTRLYVRQDRSREMCAWQRKLRSALNLRHCITFDERQQKLAAAAGLKLIRVS